MDPLSASIMSLAAPLLGGMAVLVVVAGAEPAVRRRRTVVAHLRAFVDAPGAALAAALEKESGAQARRRFWALNAQSPAWLAGREFMVLGIVGVPTVILLVSGQALLAVAGALQVLMFASLWGQNLVAARSAKLDAQTLPTVMRLSAAMRAGSSLLQGIEAIAHDAPAPTREEFARVLDEVSVGTSLDSALEHLAKRVGTADYMILSLVLTIQRRVGGNLPLILERIADTVRERIEFRRQVATLTAQQRLSTWILTLLPFFVAATFFLADRTFLMPLLTTTTGHAVLLVASTLQLVGGWALRWAGRIPT